MKKGQSVKKILKRILVAISTMLHFSTSNLVTIPMRHVRTTFIIISIGILEHIRICHALPVGASTCKEVTSSNRLTMATDENLFDETEDDGPWE
jgi:hypothetical protein